MRTFNVGILGCGVISRTYAADIKAFFPRLNIVACADVNLASAEKLAGEFDIPRACLTEDLLKDESVEIVVNLTPPQLHVALDRRIIASGKAPVQRKALRPDPERRQVDHGPGEGGGRAGGLRAGHLPGLGTSEPALVPGSGPDRQALLRHREHDHLRLRDLAPRRGALL